MGVRAWVREHLGGHACSVATANEGPMNGHPVRQPWGVVGRDKIRKGVTLGNSAVGRKRSFTKSVQLPVFSALAPRIWQSQSAGFVGIFIPV